MEKWAGSEPRGQNEAGRGPGRYRAGGATAREGEGGGGGGLGRPAPSSLSKDHAAYTHPVWIQDPAAPATPSLGRPAPREARM